MYSIPGTTPSNAHWVGCALVNGTSIFLSVHVMLVLNGTSELIRTSQALVSPNLDKTMNGLLSLSKLAPRKSSLGILTPLMGH